MAFIERRSGLRPGGRHPGTAAEVNTRFGGDEMSTDVPNSAARSSSQVAERMRLYRKRRREGLRSVRIWLPVTDIYYFIQVVLTERQRQRPDALETALVGLFQDMLEEMRNARARVTVTRQ